MYPIDLADDDKGDWVIEARGHKFSPPRRTTLSPHAQAQRSMVYSPNRILYPMKRVDWDPEGERNTQNRGISGYERISWDEALDLVCAELIREKRENGPGSILTTCSSHHLWGNLGYRHSAYYRFLNLMGMVHSAHNPDSWEGWHWGAMPMWGNSHRLGIPEQYDLLEDALKHTEMVVFWSADPESHRRRHLLRLREHLAPLLDEAARHQDGVRRPLLQPHRRALQRQVVRAAPRHRRGVRPRHRAHLARRGHLRQGVRRRAHRRLRRVEGLRPRQDRRRAQDAGVGRDRVRHPRAPDPRPRARVGRQEGRCSPPAASAAGAAPAAPPPATSGRAPWSRWPPCRATASRASTSGAPPRARRRTARSCSPATPRAACAATPRSRPPATACSTASSSPRPACTRRSTRTTHRRASPSRACASPRR